MKIGEIIKEANLPNVCSYKYAYHKKNKIEKIVNEMLASRTIKPNTSLCSSLVLHVEKTDERWRLCVDYRTLNYIIILNKFPIPAWTS